MMQAIGLFLFGVLLALLVGSAVTMLGIIITEFLLGDHSVSD